MTPVSAGSGETYCNPGAGERLTGNFSSLEGPRLLAGLGLAVSVALIAWSRRALSLSGAIAAVAVAAVCTAAGWSWASLLIAFFLSGTGLSKVGEREKRSRTSGVVEKGGERDAWQVLANGGVFAAAALAGVIWPSGIWQVFGAGALAASTADTWATEIGGLSRSTPKSIVSMRAVEPGTSGGVTWLGIWAALCGAMFIAAFAHVLGWSLRAVCAAIVGGFFGALVDSLVGATLQARRWCTQCERGTERAVHVCGTMTAPSGGIPWLNNDFVNALSSVAGALIGLSCLL
jgi:uncharacterized protein (TIGR00297 family)